ncbi:MAG: radical SAM protein, partial [Armatimonadota bacterium]
MPARRIAVERYGCDSNPQKALFRFDRGSYQLLLAPDGPCWVAVNGMGAELVADLAGRGEEALASGVRDLASRNGLTTLEAEQIVRGCAAESACVWNGPANGAYEGRAAYLRPTHLRELWLHINNRCNCACRHCLVSSGPSRDDGLPTEAVERLIGDARDLGAITFLFTGGEPLLRPDLPRLLRLILDDPEAHAVVLTNGSRINEAFLEAV